MREELAGGVAPSPLEALLIERIVICWLHLQYHEAHYAANMSRKENILHVQIGERMDKAQRRYLGAIKALAQVRRLALPSVQVNIGEKQVNVAAAQVNVGEKQVNAASV